MQIEALLTDRSGSPILETNEVGDVVCGRNLTTPLKVVSTGPLSGVGYAPGAGGAVAQASDRMTGVFLHTICGQITTVNASLAPETAAEFTVANNAVQQGDVVIACIQSGASGGNTKVYASSVQNGYFKLTVANDNAAGGAAEVGTIIINYAIIRAVNA